MIEFIKMHGCGNGYVFVWDDDGRISQRPLRRLARRLADRYRGVGSDGLVIISPSEVADARMRIFNADGSEARMCGNAIRCVGRLLYERHGRREFRVETLGGVKSLSVNVRGHRAHGHRATSVTVDMGIQIGNPHRVHFTGDVAAAHLGPHLGNDVNTEFVQVVSPTHLKMRVWERGSGETQACGTGACASVREAIARGYCAPNTDVAVEMPGGTLVIHQTDTTIFMTGDCVRAFMGVAFEY